MTPCTRLSAPQIRAAKEGSPEAVTGLLGALEGLIRARAARIDSTLAEDLAQVGREAAWLSLRRFAGTDPAQFLAFVDRTITGAMRDARKEWQRQGVSRAAASDYEKAVQIAEGDVYAAERVATTEAMGARKMSADMAFAARCSYQGAVCAPERLSQLPCPSGPAAPESPSAGRARLLLASLGAQQRRVLELTYGIGDFGRMSDSAIATELGISTERVRVVRARAHARLREKAGRSFLYR
ncbi:sigma-70 family RNA polymerase sigma factor [Streptomyces cacaoi]|uniref:sigma-70 family RNA polymerase sigma factor n=1 Tax=Streptomyces cacaoi TaxID=1898 RepID=UPI0026327E1A|nr:sigma-70 family RNA polymerase sigma factor [Streptomyces cacaoi]